MTCINFPSFFFFISKIYWLERSHIIIFHCFDAIHSLDHAIKLHFMQISRFPLFHPTQLSPLCKFLKVEGRGNFIPCKMKWVDMYWPVLPLYINKGPCALLLFETSMALTWTHCELNEWKGKVGPTDKIPSVENKLCFGIYRTLNFYLQQSFSHCGIDCLIKKR